MKTKKAILGLSLCLGMMLSMGSLQKHTQANIGWGIAKLCEASNDGTAQTVGTVGIGGAAIGYYAGAAAGAEAGAKIGALGGGLIGAGVGLVVGAL